MKINLGAFVGLSFVAMSAATTLPAAAAAVTLTQLDAIATDGTGQGLTTNGAEVSRGEFALFLAAPSGPPPVFINPTPPGPTDINVPLSLGSNTFYFFGSSDGSTDPISWALYAYFDGASVPSISGAGAEDSSSFTASPYEDFLPPSSGSTADRLAFTAPGDLNVTMTAYEMTDTGIGSFDMGPNALFEVSPDTSIPDGLWNFMGTVTFDVAVPEPSSLPLMLAGLGLIGGAMYLGRRKSKTTA